jgi:membrane associated rhomboid family serine protease
MSPEQRRRRWFDLALLAAVALGLVFNLIVVLVGPITPAGLVVGAGALGAVLTAAVALFRVGPERRQLTAQADQADAATAATISASAAALVAPLQRRIVALEAELVTAHARIAELSAEHHDEGE